MAHHRRIAWIPIVTGVAVGVVLSITGLSGNWNPLEHTVCVNGVLVAHETNRWLPVVLVNSPYSGRAYGQSEGVGVTVSNGTAGAAFVEAINASLYSLHNSSAWGPGVNHPCNRPSAVDLQFHLYGVASVTLSTISNLTDAGETSNISVFNTPSNLSTVAFFNNSFTAANAGEVSTFGEVALVLPFQSNYLTIGIPFEVDNRTVTVPYVIPFAEDFTYTFPANFGTWAIDNLSAQGGPGGGWAFDFLRPCP